MRRSLRQRTSSCQVISLRHLTSDKGDYVDHGLISSASPGGYGGYGRRGDTGVFNVGGPRGGPASSGHRYTLTISKAIRNLLNRNNPGPIIGNIGSPLFGQANQPY